MSGSNVDRLLDAARSRIGRRPTAAELPALVADGALVVDIRPVGLRERDGELHRTDPPRWKRGAAVAVVMASAGYPESASKGDVITGTDAADCDVIHAGTALADGDLVTAGGRVLAVTAVGSDLADARAKAYAGVGAIEFDGAQYRTDIAAKAADGEIRVP